MDGDLNGFMVFSRNILTQSTNPSVSYTSNTINQTSDVNIQESLETPNAVRFTRYSNPLVNYSYKSGHYLGIWDKLYPSLMTSFIEVAKNVVKAS